MVNIFKDGVSTVIAKQDIVEKFVDNRAYDFLKAGLSKDHRGVIREWLTENYGMKEHDYDAMTDFIIWRLF